MVGTFFAPKLGKRVSSWDGPDWAKTSRTIQVLGIMFSIVEKVPIPRESIFKLFPASQLQYGAKIKKAGQTSNTYVFVTYFPLFSLLDRFGAILWLGSRWDNDYFVFCSIAINSIVYFVRAIELRVAMVPA